MKKKFYTEAAYAAGIILLAVGTAFSELAAFGMSMIVAPAYILHLALSPMIPAFTFGMAEYTLQALLIIAMSLYLRRFRLGYLFSFVTAVIYGFLLDGAIFAVSFLPADSIIFRIFYYIVGILFCTSGVAMLFNTYISPEAYELFVKELSSHHGVELSRFKTVYDLASCVVAVIMSFLMLGGLQGIGIGTVICAFVNGYLIGAISGFMNKNFEFSDRLPFRPVFEK